MIRALIIVGVLLVYALFVLMAHMESWRIGREARRQPGQAR